MSIAHLLEDFTLQANGGQLHVLDEDALEEQRLASFDQGYSAGWEDATQAQESSRGQVSDDLARSLEDMSFTYHEAVHWMAQSLEPMFQSLTKVVLPETMDRGFAARLAEELTDMARTQIGQPMRVFVPEGRAAEVEGMIPNAISSPVQVVEDASLDLGQARLKVGISQREVDCSGVLAAIDQAFQAYVFQAKEAVNHE
ncbi:ABC transporter ATP-binding protein [Ruegeria sp. R14_0]|uniref:ABC transporter ATP-binding protein n=1 Tax=Ruegeria sp. R14_0 TaxID=2821100 RepID=UPI001ADCEA68|nr:ABC transporter ATP-binding protein [Ruegeria sp. R14_0]MBO9445842.1 ABC transporter ATP-binding protein [Ruegeria sp. R14_0]